MLHFQYIRTTAIIFLGMLPLLAIAQFGPKQEITQAITHPYAVKTADLDGDGLNDVISASFYGDKIVWFKNEGAGNIGAQHVISLDANSPKYIFCEDLNGDGDVDVLFSATGRIAWYENDGEGNFETISTIVSLVDQVSSVHAADLDGDGDMDVLSASFGDDKIAWYENDGAGNYSAQNIITTLADGASSVYCADMDGDGDMDVLSASSHDDKIAWYENDGSGIFGGQIVISINADGANSVYSEDVDGDGDMDVLSTSYVDDKIAWYENDGVGIFGGQNVISSNFSVPTSVYCADFDGDGFIDVISASNQGDKIAWFANSGDGSFGDENIISENVLGAQAVWAEDINGDGAIDVLSASTHDDKLAWFSNNGNGSFGEEIVISINANGATSVYSADINGDGDMDVLSASYYDDKIAWYENDGIGNFGGQNIISLNAEGARLVACADLDGDGDLDVLSASYLDNKIAWYENDGNGGFTEENVISSAAIGAYWVHSTDLDGDGDIDVLSASWDDDKIAWYINDGNGNFGVQNIISTETDGAASVHTADLDGDGDNDVLSASWLDDKIAWYENDGNGNFGAQNIIAVDVTQASSVYSADLDGDGDMDVLSTSLIDDKIAWFENDGSGNFGGQNTIALDVNAVRSVYCDDIDGDGDMDVLSSSSLSPARIYLFENNGNGDFWQEILISDNISGGRSVYSKDLDGDGLLDVLCASFNNDEISWYENQYGQGCTDSEACNYNPSATEEDGSCCFGICGCLDPEATTFNALADCEDGSCIYRLNGKVFYDENENGVWDESEYGLPLQEVELGPMGWTTFTDDEGCFSFIDIGIGQYSTELIPGENFPFVTTINPLVFEVVSDNPNTEILIGVSNEEPDFDICVDFYPPGFGYPCNDWVNHNICYRNEGNVPIDGIVEVEYDLLFQDYQQATPIDSVVANKIYMSFENLLPGQMFFYDVNLLSPTVDFIGEIITSTSRVYGFYEGNQVAFGEQEINIEMTCSYDPNDKQVFPNGHLEEHLILNETELEYLIRFQNTGNAPATHVLVTDTIDENLDLETFMVMANSHSVQTTVKPEERVIQFFFENIMLPDSSANEPESHGLISFKIAPYPDLEPGTVLNNTGNIFFDNNPPIITNTTWNTIHECGGEADYSILSEIHCEGVEVELSANYEWLESASWEHDGQELSSTEQLILDFNELGSYEYTLTASNPLCQESVTFIHEVDELPQLPPCFADFNCDGHRDTIDLLDFLLSFGCLNDCDKDMNNDGMVTVLDLSVFLGLVGNDCEE